MKLVAEVILASVREGRQGEKVARWIHRIAGQRPDLEATLADLREIALPTFAHRETTKAAESKYTDPAERAWVERVGRADGFIIVTPEYNHGYPPTLKNALDCVYAGWNQKPVAFVSYGGVAGGVRAVEQLRLVAIELQMVPIRNEVNIPFIGRAFDEQGEPHDAALATRAGATLDQLAWWMTLLKEGRANHPLPAPPR